MNIVETWTRADVASRRGEWKKAIELWTKIKSFYEQHRHAPGSIQFIEECDTHIRRGRKYTRSRMNRQSQARKKTEIPLLHPKPCRKIRDKTVDSIMIAFDDVATTHNTIQNSDTISPQPLHESFYIVPSPSALSESRRTSYALPLPLAYEVASNVSESSERPKKNVYEELMESNRKLRKLQKNNAASFYNIKKAMEKLSPENAYLFPDKLKSRYSILMKENRQLKSKLLKIKTNLKNKFET